MAAATAARKATAPPPPPPLTVLRSHTSAVTAVTIVQPPLPGRELRASGSLVGATAAEAAASAELRAAATDDTGSAALLVSGARDGSVKVWHLSTRRVACEFVAHTGFGVLALEVHGARLVTQGRDGGIRVWLVPLIDAVVLGHATPASAGTAAATLVGQVSTRAGGFCKMSLCESMVAAPSGDGAEVCVWDLSAALGSSAVSYAGVGADGATGAPADVAPVDGPALEATVAASDTAAALASPDSALHSLTPGEPGLVTGMCMAVCLRRRGGADTSAGAGSASDTGPSGLLLCFAAYESGDLMVYRVGDDSEGDATDGDGAARHEHAGDVAASPFASPFGGLEPLRRRPALLARVTICPDPLMAMAVDAGASRVVVGAAVARTDADDTAGRTKDAQLLYHVVVCVPPGGRSAPGNLDLELEVDGGEVGSVARGVSSLAVRADGRIVAAACWDGSVRLFDFRDRTKNKIKGKGKDKGKPPLKPLAVLPCIAAPTDGAKPDTGESPVSATSVHSVAFGNDPEGTLVGCGEDCRVTVWQLFPPSTKATRRGLT